MKSTRNVSQFKLFNFAPQKSSVTQSTTGVNQKLPFTFDLETGDADLTFSLAWANILSPDWRRYVSHALHYRMYEYNHFHHYSQDRVTSGPMFPCHKEEGFLQIQRAKIPDVLVGEGCLNCFHEEKSKKKSSYQ